MAFSPTAPLVALTAALTLGLAACERASEPQPTPASAPAAPPAPEAAPATPPTLNRAELLRAMQAAASVYAVGGGQAADTLAGRRFVVRQAFGCAGAVDGPAVAGDGLARAVWRDDRHTIELNLTPGDWKGSALVAGAAADWEAVEGLWLARPWLDSEACPDVRADPLAAGPAGASPQTMGLAAVFESGGSRLTQRNGRAYSFTLRGKGDQPPTPAPRGYRLVLEGRLVAFADGRAIQCRAASPDQRPVCVAATRLDRVAFEDADGQVLSEWRPG